MVIIIGFAILLIVIGIVLLWQPAWLPKVSREQTANRVTQATSKVVERAKETVEKADRKSVV